MTPAAYYDWWLYSGIYPGIPTRPANHAALRERLSTPGVHLIVLWGLLHDNAEFDETSYIGPTNIYGSRERTIEAARGVGAVRLAEYLSSLPDTSVAPETHKELKKLLKQFTVRHEAELTADIARHGDPRAAPGFDKRQARRRRDEQWGANNQRYQVADLIPFFTEPMKELRTLLAKGMTLAEVRRQNEEIGHLACCIQYDVPRWAEAPQPAEVAAFLDECRRLAQQYPAQMPAWGALPAELEKYYGPSPQARELSADQDLPKQLQAMGSYRVEQLGRETMITWDSVAALDNDFGHVGLRFLYEGKFPPRLLDAWPDVQRRFAAALPAMTQALLAQGRARSKGSGADDLLSQVGEGMLSITFDANRPDCLVECSWDVEWDPEHGCLFEIDERGVRRVD